MELDVSGITDDAPGTNNYITRYAHPIDLMIHNTISAQIELGTVLEFNTADTTIRHNFTIHYVENDDPNDDVIRLGHTDINYELDTHAIGITFERVHTPFNVSITNDAGNYVPVESFEFTTTIENSTNAWDILDDSTNSHYLGTLYTYDKATRTVTVWTSHLSDVRLNSTSSGGGDESDSNSPTLGKATNALVQIPAGLQMASEYNGLTVNVLLCIHHQMLAYRTGRYKRYAFNARRSCAIVYFHLYGVYIAHGNQSVGILYDICLHLLSGHCIQSHL